MGKIINYSNKPIETYFPKVEEKKPSSFDISSSIKGDLISFQRILDNKKKILSELDKESVSKRDIELLLSELDNAFDKLVCSHFRV